MKVTTDKNDFVVKVERDGWDMPKSLEPVLHCAARFHKPLNELLPLAAFSIGRLGTRRKMCDPCNAQALRYVARSRAKRRQIKLLAASSNSSDPLYQEQAPAEGYRWLVTSIVKSSMVVIADTMHEAISKKDNPIDGIIVRCERLSS